MGEGGHLDIPATLTLDMLGNVVAIIVVSILTIVALHFIFKKEE